MRPVDPNSAAYIASIGLTGHLHPDFGTNPSYGIPYTVVGSHQPKVPIKFTEYGEESNPGPYPIPANAPVEGAGEAGDRHVLVLQEGSCKLYELYNAQRARERAGKRARAPSSTCARTRCAPTAGPRRTPPGCRSFRCSCAIPKSARVRSTTRCA